MRDALLCYVAIPCTQEVLDLLHILSISVDSNYLNDKVGKGYGLFIYSHTLGIEEVDQGSEWVLNDEHILEVLTLFANKDINSICTYLNSIPNRPFNVFTSAAYKSI